MPGRVGHEKASQFALLNCTQPVRGKSQAIEHNRALPKVGQSLRRLRLVAYRWRALRVRVMVFYVGAPARTKAMSALCVDLVSAARRWPTLNREAALPRLMARSLAGVAGS
jgi:hypothetical protein